MNVVERTSDSQSADVGWACIHPVSQFHVRVLPVQLK
jgi:hypothetical protein